MKQFSELELDFQRQLLAFVHTELETGATFADSARTEGSMGNHPRADHNIELAANACLEARRRLNECDPSRMPAVFNAAVSKLRALEAQIAELRLTHR